MVNKKDDWHRERRIGKAVKAGIKCFCGSEAYRDILEVTMNCETFPRVHRIFCPNCGLQMRSPAGNDDDFIVRQWRDILKAQEPHWISVEDGLPQEHDTIFAKFYGTDKWRNGMFVKVSDDVRVVKVYRDGTKRVHHDHTVDGRWESERKGLDVYGHVTHWMPNPELPFCTSCPSEEQRKAEEWK